MRLPACPRRCGPPRRRTLLAESFFSMLNNERVYRTVYATKSQARNDVMRYIEGF